jgi:hypothetical protein
MMKHDKNSIEPIDKIKLCLDYKTRSILVKYCLERFMKL